MGEARDDVSAALRDPQRGLSKFYHKKARSFACLSNLFMEKDARVLAKETRRDEDDAVSDTASLVDRGVPLMVGDTAGARELPGPAGAPEEIYD